MVKSVRITYLGPILLEVASHRINLAASLTFHLLNTRRIQCSEIWGPSVG